MYCMPKTIINDKIPEIAKYFKEELVEDVLVIPCQKPDMERILDMVAWAEIESYNLIATDIGYSNEGQRLTGHKLIIEVKIKEKLTYVANQICQSAHAAHYEKLKSIFVILPEKVDNMDICDFIRSGRINITPHIEGSCYRQLNEREVHRGLMLFIDVKMC